jgi:hypothetical protein
MGLSKDIENAFLKSMDLDNIDDDKSKKIIKKNMKILSADLTEAISKFIQAQVFNITKMEAALEVESIRTATSTFGSVLPKVTYVTPAGTPAPLVGGNKGVVIPALQLSSKTGVTGGRLDAKGKAYIGPNDVGPSNEKKTKVQLLKVKGK